MRLGKGIRGFPAEKGNYNKEKGGIALYKAALLLLLLMPLAYAAYNIDQNKVCLYPGAEVSSSTYKLHITAEQGTSGQASGTNFVTQIGCIYGFENNPPIVGQLQFCDGSCTLRDTDGIDPATAFTIQANISDPNGNADINTETFRVTLFHNTDVNTCSEDWDCNAMTVMDDALWLGTQNGCTQSGNTYCINIPATSWTTKFMWGDLNIYVAVDDNAGAYDSNAIDVNTTFANKMINLSEDTTTGTYAGAPDSNNNAFTSTQTSNSYVETTHSGNLALDLNVLASLFWNSSTLTTMGWENESWDDSNVASESVFTGANDSIKTDFNRGVYPTSSTFHTYLWLDVPGAQLSGSYDGNLTFGAEIT